MNAASEAQLISQLKLSVAQRVRPVSLLQVLSIKVRITRTV
jgi:hypothetical protein